MIIRLKRNKYFFTAADDEAKALFERLPIGAEIELELYEESKPKTPKQRRATHLWFTHVAEWLNGAGFDVKTFLEKFWASGVGVPWAGVTVKEYLFRPVMEAMTHKKSSEHLTTVELIAVCKVLDAKLLDLLGEEPPDYPSKPRPEDEEAMSRYGNRGQ